MLKATLEIDPPEIRHLDEAWLDGPFTRLLPAADFLRCTTRERRVWCHHRTRYQLATAELVTFLRNAIAGRSALEICAGMGDLCHHLKIEGVDDAQQLLRPDVRAHFQCLGQPITVPPGSVTREDAIAAVRRIRPQVVIGCWVTQKYVAGDEHAGIGSNRYGVDEIDLMQACGVETYIHVGNRDTNGEKRILAIPHEELQFDWLVSRATDPTQNVIYRWGK